MNSDNMHQMPQVRELECTKLSHLDSGYKFHTLQFPVFYPAWLKVVKFLLPLLLRINPPEALDFGEEEKGRKMEIQGGTE